MRDHPNARRLPAVIPMVVHYGRGRWGSPVQLMELITPVLLKTAAGNPRIPAELRSWARQLRAVLPAPP